MFWRYKKLFYLCNRKSEMIATAGCSTVRLVYLVWDQGVVSSNPTTPTQNSETTCREICRWFFVTTDNQIKKWKSHKRIAALVSVSRFKTGGS